VVAALPHGEHIIFYGNGTALRVWSLKAHSELATLRPYGSRVSLLDETRVLTGGYELLLWIARSGARIRGIATKHRGDVSGIAARGDLGLAETA
jgi:hypothetical protein